MRLVTLLIPLVVFGCRSILEPDPRKREFVAMVEELDVPPSILAGDTLHIKARVYVGPDGCYAHQRVEIVRSRERLELTFVGMDMSRRDIYCLQRVHRFDWEGAFPPSFPPPTFTVAVNQPDGSRLVRKIAVDCHPSRYTSPDCELYGS